MTAKRDNVMGMAVPEEELTDEQLAELPERIRARYLNRRKQRQPQQAQNTESRKAKRNGNRRGSQ